MIKAVLLDLDDTLLGNPTQQFVENYLSALDRFLMERLNLPDISRPLLLATREVINNHDPLHKNIDVFYDALTPLLPVDRESFETAVSEFYSTVYPQLQVHTHRQPDARPLVEWLIERDYQVIVATNPFFPRTAIEQRLAWAGLPADEIPFRLVTTLENMHFSKPHAHYYEEILAWIGVQSDEAIMVGDDWNNDIVPAWQAGLNTFLTCGDLTQPPVAGAVRPDGYGTLGDFARRVQNQNWLETLTPRPLVPAQILPRLTANLAALLGIVSEVPPHTWHMRPLPTEWTPMEVLCHLRDSERDIQRPRLETIYREENPFLSSPNPPPGPGAWVCEQTGWEVALEFASQRLETLEFLDGLEADDWHRPARHSIFGPTTLLEMANFTAQHDRLHSTQLCQTVHRCV